ncbi:MAG TPA: hypothetical protein VFQ65_07690 [Kofleriaceae bacterium]|nr:hypothetical protein [Kofleriaceae bacterium]
MSRYLVLGSFLALSALAACEGAEAKPAPATTQQKMQATTANADHDLCVAFVTHARTCTDQYIPALVDARAAVDHPTGIKDEVAKDRAGVIAQAKQEWASDSTDQAIEQMCSSPKLAEVATDDRRQRTTTCNANSDCAAYTACAVPIFAENWAH